MKPGRRTSQAISVVAFFLLWEGVSRSGLVNASLFPPPSAVLRALLEMARSGELERDVATSLLTATSGSSQTSPSFWLNPQNNVSYNIAVQAPQYALDGLQDLENIPITIPGSASVSNAALAATAPNAKLIVLPGVGHMVQNAAPDLVISEIEAMIGRTTPSGGATAAN